MTLKALSLGWVASVLLVSLAGATQARANTCEVPLRNVLIDSADCAYYVTAFRMMATRHVSVDAVCKKGKFAAPNGEGSYTAQVSTTLTLHDSSCSSTKPIRLNPVLLSKPFCSNLQKVVGMLGTDFVDVQAGCAFGSWTGADGNPRSSMVAARATLKPRRIAQK